MALVLGLALAYIFLAGGRNLEGLDTLRDDAAPLDMLGAEMLPDPTNAGYFRRRFAEEDVWALQRALNRIRPELWKRGLSGAERRVARIDADGTIVPTTSVPRSPTPAGPPGQATSSGVMLPSARYTASAPASETFEAQ